MHQLRKKPVSDQGMGKRLRRIRQCLWLPLFESKLLVKLMKLLQLLAVLCVIQSKVNDRNT